MLSNRLLGTVKRSLEVCSSLKHPKASDLRLLGGKNVKISRPSKNGIFSLQGPSWQRWYSSSHVSDDHQTVPWARNSVKGLEEPRTRNVSKTEKDNALLASMKRGDMKQLKRLLDDVTESDWSNVRTVELILRGHAILGLDASAILEYCLNRIDVWSDSDFERLSPVLLNECRLRRHSKMRLTFGGSSVPQLIYQSAKSRSNIHLSSSFYVAYARALLLSARSVEEQKQFALELIRILDHHDPHTLDLSPFCSTVLQNLVGYHGIGPEGWYWGGVGSKLELRNPVHHEALIARIWGIIQAKNVIVDLSLAHACLKAFAAGHMDLNFAEHIHQALLAQQISLPPYCIALIIAGLYSRGLHNDAIQWIGVLNQSTDPLPYHVQSLSLTTLLSIHTKRGDIEKAKEILDQAMALQEDKRLDWLLPVLQAHSQPLTIYACEKYALVPTEGRKHLAFLQLVPALVKLGKVDLAIFLTESIASAGILSTEDLHGLKESLKMVYEADWSERQKSSATYTVLGSLCDAVAALPTITDTKALRKLLKQSVLALLEALRELQKLPNLIPANSLKQGQ
jgi:hypothetical protein